MYYSFLWQNEQVAQVQELEAPLTAEQSHCIVFLRKKPL